MLMRLHSTREMARSEYTYTLVWTMCMTARRQYSRGLPACVPCVVGGGGSGLIPMRVIVDVNLRRTLKLTRREKKARIFFPPEVSSDFNLFLDMVYEAFPVAGFPHTLVARVREGEEEEGPSTEFVISGPEDLQRALDRKSVV